MLRKSRRNVLRGIAASTAGLGLAISTTSAQTGHADVLLVKDCDPWSNTANEDILNERAISYDLITSSDFGEHDLSGYCSIILPSTQDQAYYDNLFASRGKLRDFVSAGNVLVAHATDEGKPCSTTWTDSFLPGGVDKNNPHEDDLTIVDGDHPVVDGLTDSDLSGWNSSTHGYLIGLPEGSNVVVGISGDPTGQPTYVEYGHGNGTVLATMMTLEWDDSDKRMLENEIDYMTDLCDDVACIPRREAGRDTPPELVCQTDRELSRSGDRRVSRGIERRRRSR